MWTDGSTRVVLAGAPGAGKSRLLDAIASAANVPVVVGPGTRWLETTTARRRYQIVDAQADAVDPLIANAHLVVLVVAATDGPMPATRRHVEAIQHARLGRCIVYLDDTSVEDVEITELVEMEVRDLVNGKHLDAQVVRGRSVAPSGHGHSGREPRPQAMGGVGALAAALDAA